MRAPTHLRPKQSQQPPPPAMQQHRAGAIEQQPDPVPQGAGQLVAGGKALGTEFNRHGLGMVSTAP